MGLGERLRRSLRGVQFEAVSGCSHRELGQHLLAELRRHIGFDAACSATLDPVTTMWTSCEVMGGRRDLEFESRLFDVEYRRPDVAKLVDIARRVRPVAILSAETGGDLERSERYRAVHAPAGLGDEIRLLLRDAGVPWGCVHLTRACDSRPFAVEDGEALVALSVPLARAFRHTLLRMAIRTTQESVPRAIGVLLVRGTTLVEASSEARIILGDAAPDTALPAAAHGVIAMAQAGVPARMSCPTAVGEWATLHATRIGGEVALIVERSSPVELLDVVVNALGLSERERSVVHTVARGLNTKEIALELGIGEWTVQDHLKSIFAKANVTSRQALIAALFFGYWAPDHERGATPSPYGHYLRGGQEAKS